MTGHIPATDANRRLEQLDSEQRDPGKRKALFLAAGVHLALIAALVLGVQWKSQPPASVEVEVWRSPNPPAVTPPPQPKSEPKPEPRVEPKPEAKPELKTPAKPDIAIKEEKKPKEPPKPEPKKEEPRKEEAKKPEPKPEPKKAEDKPKPLHDPFAELDKESKQRERQREMQRQREHADAEARQLDQLKAEQSAASRSRELANYAGKVRTKIRGFIVLPPGIQGNPEALFEVTQLPSGEVLAVHIRKSSGNPALDAAVERAILKASPLPKPDSPELFERVLKIPYRPFD